ncbi:beta-mannosidase [Flavobacterium cauense R2A-7]|uniref:Beta-mannosidase n=1 Tax=Flavobacterium cauense R2A-7 TaxID=1341154 RepID=A0A562LSA9_9FLAO|nr:glycoside hydrolase family 2 protein [Flavobacterium cauense]KGO80144.1 beta-mannosidase [Flavobacterium cauense R2A-7]TWI10453.1 beta-mannosidase [Flavobacterium cauense R2A-7]
MKIFLKFLMIFCLPLLVLAQNSDRNLGKEHWIFRKKGDVQWLPASVPGTVHTDLFNNNVIPNPFFGANEKQLQWIENEAWEYETTFTVSAKELKSDTVELQFDGLDTYAEVFLNGKSVLKADNMFRIWKIDVKNQLKVGQNKLTVVFQSAVKKGKEAAKKLNYTLPGDEKIFTRKAQYHYGWDWGPRFVTAGIWKKVKLNFWNSVTIENVKYEQKLLSDEVAKLVFTTEVHCQQSGKYQLKVNDKSETYSLKKGKNQLKIDYEIKKPKRWWCNGLGEAYLYPFAISLSDAKGNSDKKEMNIGLRTVELVQEMDKVGKSFYFKLNGVPVFMKGANYIPPDSFLPKAKDSVYKSIVKNAVDANMNMLRVWGGGVYADDAFYEECDKKGILVWQDFMFACAMYPGDDAFLENVKQEVVDNVNRLQNHPSVALWCGNNESDEGWHNWGWQKQYNYSAVDSTKIWSDYEKLFHELIPKTLNSLLSKEKNSYWPSSPSIGWGRKESLLQGDSHYWGVWWGMEPFEMYTKKVGRFMSEYGFQGMPDLETLRSFANESDLNLQSDVVKNHQKHPTGYQTIQTYMERDYKFPTNFEDFIYVSQLLQAEGMKTAIEAHRQAKPYCMGTLYWQLNDCWPVTSWSSVDYFGTWKAFHYQAKRSFENVLVSVAVEENQYKVYVISDEVSSKKGKLVLQLLDFEGKILWQSASEIQVAENTAKVYYTMDKKMFEKFNSKQTVLSVKFVFSDSDVKSTLFYFEKPKDLELKRPKIMVKHLDENTLEVSTDILVKNVFLSSEGTHFSDNYFDLLPGEKRKIHFEGKTSEIVIKSLYY